MFGWTFRLRIPGAWQDAWLYKDALLLWSRENVLHRITIERLKEILNREVGDGLSPIFEIAFFRNDWKTGEQYKQFVSISGVSSAIQSALSANFPSRDAVLVLELPLDELEVEPVPGVILDTEIYGNRVYLATTQGAYETRYVPKFAEEWQPTIQLTDHRTSSVSARYSCVNVSAGGEGLLFKSIRFGPQEDPNAYLSEENLRRVAEQSESTGFAFRNLLNYWGGPIPSLLRSRGHHAPPHDQARHESFAIEGYGEAESIDDLAWSAFASTSNNVANSMDRLIEAEKEEIEVLGNAGVRLLVAASGVVGVLDIKWKNKTETRIERSSLYGTKRFSIPSDQVLSTHQLGTDFLVEQFDTVSLVSPEGVRTIFQGAAASIRTFSESVRFREVAVIVTDDALELFGSL